MKKVLMLFGLGLMTFCSCNTFPEVKYIPVYRKPINLCKSVSKVPKCDVLKGKTDFDKFGLLKDCLVDYRAYILSLRAYIECLENSLEDSDE
jgi:hypothetical protein